MLNKTTAKTAADQFSGAELLSAIRAAAARIRDSVWCSPCQFSASLSAASGQKVHLKLENLQMTGSYKERGALNKILLLTPEQRKMASSPPPPATTPRPSPITPSASASAPPS